MGAWGPGGAGRDWLLCVSMRSSEPTIGWLSSRPSHAAEAAYGGAAGARSCLAARPRRFSALVCSAFVMAAEVTAAAGAAAEESTSVAAMAMSVPDSTGGSPGAEGEGVGTAGEEKDAAPKGAEVVGDSEEDGDDVFEVEKILDMKCEGVRGGCAASRGGGGGGRSRVGHRAAGRTAPIRERWVPSRTGLWPHPWRTDA